MFNKSRFLYPHFYMYGMDISVYMCIYVHDSKGSFPLRQKFQFLLLVVVLVRLGCHNKIP